MAIELGGSKEQPNHAGISFDTTTKKKINRKRGTKSKKGSPSYKPTPTQCHVIIINSLSQKLNYINIKPQKTLEKENPCPKWITTDGIIIKREILCQKLKFKKFDVDKRDVARTT